ncbi:hypothetical protein POTOM_042373 [Populus tomentosa]|uniref:Uncharacterized protein n=1 Tax=Populus tomentosa TaxID=118781 RepID=A0A8X8C9Z5_POPTO|nr:hypothetical protein POTOM_042373 [Populus tomentosa]
MSVRGREEQDCCGKQLIDGNGVMLKVEGPGNFMRATKMSDCGASVAIHASVAILGPQSSGLLRIRGQGGVVATGATAVGGKFPATAPVVE